MTPQMSNPKVCIERDGAHLKWARAVRLSI